MADNTAALSTDLLNRDPLLAPVRGIFAAQEIKPQARGLDDPSHRLF